jgi:amino acid transporter
MAMMLSSLLITVFLLSLWGTVSLAHVPANRLAASSIPYTLAAREIAGQTGRILMGLVVIAGAGCAVIALFSATARMAASLARLNMLPRICRGSARRNAVVISVLASAVTAMMAAGFAGEPELEIFIRAGFLLWLLHIVLVHLAAVKTHDPNASTGTPAGSCLTFWATVLAAMLIGAGAIYLWVTDADRVRLLVTMIAVWVAGTVMLVTVWLGTRRTKRSGPEQSGS